MRLSNTMMINETLLPTGKRAFTLAEVLITLSILGVVAALTIPTLVNRQSDLAAQTRIKKAISAYEDVIGIYMAENEATSAANMMDGGAGAACTNAGDYFKIADTLAADATGCSFTTVDGAAWRFDPATGNATVVDSATNPRYGVIMWNLNSRVNTVGASNSTDNVPADGDLQKATYNGVTLVNGSRGLTDAIHFMQGRSGNDTYSCPQGQIATVTGNALARDVQCAAAAAPANP